MGTAPEDLTALLATYLHAFSVEEWGTVGEGNTEEDSNDSDTGESIIFTQFLSACSSFVFLDFFGGMMIMCLKICNREKE